MRKCSRFMGVIAVGALAVGVSVYAAPRADDSARGPSKSDASRLVTGQAAHLQSVIDGGVAGGGIFVSLTPIPPINGNGDTYPPDASIAGNTITLAGGPQRIWFELTFGGWGPDNLETWQVGISEASFASGPGDPLVRPVEACPAPTPAASPECAAVYGQGSTCSDLGGGPICDIGWYNAANPDGHGLELAAVAQPAPVRFGATKGPFQAAIPDPGGDVYGGNLVLDAQAGSAGTYTVEPLQDASTFFTTDAGSPQVAVFTPGVVDIPIGRCCVLIPESCVDDTTLAQCNDLGGIFIDDGTDCTSPCISTRP